MPDIQDESEQEVMEQLKALGYIDPGAGSSMWQVALAGFLGFANRVKSIFKKSSSSGSSGDASDED